MSTVLLGVLGFTLTIVALAGLVLLGRALLLPRGSTRITLVNGGKRHLESARGSTLLDALGTAGVLIPSACGGQGTCGLCRVRLVAGGGRPLPTERPHLTPAQIRDGERLACQIRLRQPVEMVTPEGAAEARRWTCRVLSTRSLSTFIKEVVLELPPGERMEFQTGSYVQIDIPATPVRFRDFDIDEPYLETWERLGLLELESNPAEPSTRAYSMANSSAEGPRVMLNVRIALPPPDHPTALPGVGSSYLFALKEGDTVEVSGPFGDFHVVDSDKEMCLIGGGAGMAPLRAHIFDQLERLETERTMTFWYGARSLQEAFYVEELVTLARKHGNFRWELALSEPETEDRWDGPTGFIHEVVRDLYLRDHPEPEMVEYYLCGPPPMIRATLHMLSELGVDREDVRYDAFA